MNVYTYRRGSIFWALILIGVGGVFLWQNFNPDVHPWQMIAKFWPVVIIFWGLSKLIDYMQAQAHPDTVAPPLFSGSEVVMLVLILVLGTMVSKVILRPWQHWGWGDGDDEIANLFLNSYTFTQNFSQPVSVKPHLTLENQRGDLEIHGADQSGIDVMAKKTVRAEDENAAKRIADSVNLGIAEEAGHYVLRSNGASLPNEGRHLTVDLNLRVPLGTSCEVDAERGDIAVEDLNGDQTFNTHGGDVRVSNLQGLLKIHKSGGSTEVRGLKGSVELEGRGDNIDISDVSDSVTVHGEFSGSLQFRNVAQTLRYESMRTDMTAQKLSGSLNMEVGSLEVNGIEGPLDVKTRQKDVNVTDFKHSVQITDSDGQISLQTTTPPTHDIQVDAKKGGVELTLPPNSNFQIDASSPHGEVECDFSGPALKVVKEGDAPSISGTYGKGGPMIRIHTDYGTIRILHSGAGHPETTAPHAPPAPPAPSGKAQTTRNHGFDFRPPYFRPARQGASVGFSAVDFILHHLCDLRLAGIIQ